MCNGTSQWLVLYWGTVGGKQERVLRMEQEPTPRPVINSSHLHVGKLPFTHLFFFVFFIVSQSISIFFLYIITSYNCMHNHGNIWKQASLIIKLQNLYNLLMKDPRAQRCSPRGEELGNVPSNRSQQVHPPAPWGEKAGPNFPAAAVPSQNHPNNNSARMKWDSGRG